VQDSATTGLDPLLSVRGLGATEFDSTLLADAGSGGIAPHARRSSAQGLAT